MGTTGIIVWDALCDATIGIARGQVDKPRKDIGKKDSLGNGLGCGTNYRFHTNKNGKPKWKAS